MCCQLTSGWYDVDYITLDYIHFESSLHPYPAFLKHNWLLQDVTCPSWPDVLSSTIRFWIVVMSCGGARQTKMHGDEESCVLWCGTADRTAYHCILKCRVHRLLSHCPKEQLRWCSESAAQCCETVSQTWLMCCHIASRSMCYDWM